MPQEIILLSLPLILAFANRIRGGLFGDKLRKSGQYIAAAIVGGLVGLLTNNPVVGIFVTIGYVVGEIFSWGKWIAPVPHFFDKSWQSTYDQTIAAEPRHRDDGKDSGIHAIAQLFVKQYDNFTNYSILCLFLRGIWWWAPVYVTVAVLGGMPIINAIVAIVATGIAFPVSFIVANKIRPNDFWGTGEYIYGGLQGVILAGAFYLV